MTVIAVDKDTVDRCCARGIELVEAGAEWVKYVGKW